MPEIIEFYGDYEPPFDVGRVVRGLLRLVPPGSLAGLQSIVLTASSQLPSRERRRKKRHRGRSFLGKDARGCYRAPRRGAPASIELYVDNMVKHRSPEELADELGRARIVGSTLFHEIGHHIHHRRRKRNVDSEIAADEWEARLLERVERGE